MTVLGKLEQAVIQTMHSQLAAGIRRVAEVLQEEGLQLDVDYSPGVVPPIVELSAIESAMEHGSTFRFFSGGRPDPIKAEIAERLLVNSGVLAELNEREGHVLVVKFGKSTFG